MRHRLCCWAHRGGGQCSLAQVCSRMEHMTPLQIGTPDAGDPSKKSSHALCNEVLHHPSAGDEVIRFSPWITTLLRTSNAPTADA